MTKEKDLQYIKNFAKISISAICKELNINRSNVLNGNASAKNTEAVKNKIKEKLQELNGER